MPAEAKWLSLKVVQEPSNSDLKKPYRFSIPKKVVRLATRRNRIRRLLREVLRKDVKIQNRRVLYVFTVGRWPGEISYQDVKKSVEAVWQK